MYCDAFHELADRRFGAKDLLATVTAFVQGELARLEKEQRQLWQRIGDDYGQNFGRGSGWVFRYGDNAILIPPTEEEAE